MIEVVDVVFIKILTISDARDRFDFPSSEIVPGTKKKEEKRREKTSL